MNDQVRMSVLDSIQDLPEKLQALPNREAVAVAVGGQRRASDVLQSQVRLAILCEACIEQARDVRVSKTREDFALPGQSLIHHPPRKGWMDELQSYVPREQTVSSLGQPNASH